MPGPPVPPFQPQVRCSRGAGGRARLCLTRDATAAAGGAVACLLAGRPGFRGRGLRFQAVFQSAVFSCPRVETKLQL